MMAESLNPSTAEFRPSRVDRILVIEHDPDLQKIIRRALVSEVCEVDFAKNAIIGMALVRQQTHSALIVDFHSCGDQGPDVCRQLMEAAPRIPFVVISANPSSVDKVLFLEMGVDDYMAIPFSSRELVARLHAVQRRTLQFTPEKFYIFGTVMVDFVVRRDKPA
jgi:DNA-binding response OmpR family regulator